MKTIYEAAEIFGVHWQTINNWIKTGELKAVKVGRVVRIPNDEIERFIKQHETK